MKWTKETDYNLISGCGRYRISKTLGPPGVRYFGWRIGVVPHLICTAVLEEAKAMCELHGGKK